MRKGGDGGIGVREGGETGRACRGEGGRGVGVSALCLYLADAPLC